MAHVTLTYSDDLAEAITDDPADQASYLRLMAALKLFEIGQLSLRRAAELAGLTHEEFIAACARYHVSLYNYPTSELAEQLDRDAAALDVEFNAAFVSEMRASLAEAALGQVRRYATTEELMAAIDQYGDEDSSNDDDRSN